MLNTVESPWKVRWDVFFSWLHFHCLFCFFVKGLWCFAESAAAGFRWYPSFGSEMSAVCWNLWYETKSFLFVLLSCVHTTGTRRILDRLRRDLKQQDGRRRRRREIRVKSGAKPASRSTRLNIKATSRRQLPAKSEVALLARAASNFIALIPSHSFRQILAIFPGVEF